MIASTAMSAVAVDPALFAASNTFTYTNPLTIWSNAGYWMLGNGYPNGINEIASLTGVDLALAAPGFHTMTVDTNVTIGSLIFGDANTSSPGGWLLQLGGPSTLTLATGSITQPTISVGAMGNNSTFSLAEIIAPLISTAAFNKTGIGLLRLSGNNSAMSGSLTITAGTLEVGSNANLGVNTDPTVNLAGGTLSLRSSTAMNLSSRNLLVSANGAIYVDRAVNDNSTTDVIHQVATVTMGSGSRQLSVLGSNGFGASIGAVVLSSASTGASINQLSSAVLTLGSLSAGNTSAATLTFGGTGNATTGGNISIPNAISQTAGPLSVVYSDNHTIQVGSFANVTGSLSVTGGGTMVVGAGTLPSGPLTVAAGTLDFSGSGQTSSVASLLLGTTTNNQNSRSYINSGSGTLAVGGSLVYQVAGNSVARLAGGATIAGNLDLENYTHSLVINGIATLSSAGTPEFNLLAATSGSGKLIKSGSGQLLLSGANILSSDLVISGGTVSGAALASGNSLPGGAVTLSAGTLRLVNLAATPGSGSIGSLTFAGSTAEPAGLMIDSGTASAATTLRIGTLSGRIPGTTGALTIVPAQGAFGTSELINVDAVSPSVDTAGNHGIIAPYIVAQKSSVDTSLEFVTTVGTQLVGGSAAYQNGDINSAPDGTVYATNTSANLIAPKTLFAVKADGSLANIAGTTLTIGDGAMGGIILNNGAHLSTSGLNISATEAYLWAGGTTPSGSGGTISSAVSLSTSTLVKQGAETLTISGPVNLNGANRNINVNDGVLLISGDLSNGTLTKSGVNDLVLTGSNAGFSGTIAAGQGTIQIGKGASTPSAGLGNAKLDAGNGTIIFHLDDVHTLSNYLTSSGTGNFIVDSPSGTLAFNNATSNFSRMTIQSGAVQLVSNNSLPTNSTLTVQGTGLFDLNGRSQTIGALAGASTPFGAGAIINAGAAEGTLTIGIASGSSTYGGLIQNGTGLTVVKTGAGTQILSGTNTFAGGTRLGGGTLQLQSNSAAGTGSIQFLGGNLAIGSNLSMSNTISFGTSATIGIVNNSTSGTLNGAIAGTGALNIVWGGSGQTLNIAGAVAPAFTGTIVTLGSSGALRITATQTAGSTYDLSNSTLDFRTSATTFGFNQGSVSVTMPYIVGGDNATIGLGANNRMNHYVVGAQGGNQSFRGTVVDGGSPTELIKSGNDLFTLTSSVAKTHSFTGPIRIQSGTFVLGNNSVLSGTPTIQLEGGNLAIAGNATIAGNTEIRISPTGVLDLTQVPAGWSTPPTVTIAGTGDIVGGFVHNAGTLAPGGFNTPGTMTFNSQINPAGVTLGAGVVNLDVRQPGSFNSNIGSGTNDLILINGDVKFSPSTNFRINYIGTTSPTAGSDFPILFYTGIKSGWGANSVSTTSGIVSSAYRSAWTLKDLTGGVIAAHLDSFSGGNLSMKWAGSISGTWDLNFTKNFQISNVGTNFFQNDTVTFDNGGANRPSVTLTNAIYLPGAIVFNNGSNVVNYTLSGPGTLSGNTGILMTGTGVAMINTANTYGGNTTITRGTVDVGDFSGARYANTIINSPLGLGTVYLGNAAGDSTLSVGNASFVNDINVGTNQIGNLNFSNGSASLYGSFRGGGTINLRGNGGNLNLYADNIANNGTINVLGSSIFFRIGSVNAPGNMYWNFVTPRPLTTVINDPSGNEINFGAIAGSGTLTAGTGTAIIVSDRSFVIGSRNLDSTWNGAIENSSLGAAGSGGVGIVAETGLIKAGTALLVLTGSHNYTGQTVVRQGVLQLSNGGKIAGRNLRVQNGGMFRLGTPGGTLSTAGTFTSANTGLLLSVDSGGQIDLSSAYDSDPDITGNTAFATAGGTTFAGNGGTIVGNIRHQSGTISPGRDTGFGSIGSLNFSSALRLSGGAISLDVGSTALDHDTLNAGTIDISAGTVTINVIGNSIAAGQSYQLMNAGNLTGNSGVLNLMVNGRGASGTLETAGTSIALKMLTPATSDAITWQADSGATWDVKGGQNWRNSTASSDYFYQGDTVAFTNAGAGTVSLAAAPVPAGEVLVNSTGTYTFAGPGKISGNATLHKTGGGVLAILTENDYTGGTLIDPGGTIALGKDNRLSTDGSYSASSQQNGSLISSNKAGSLGSGSIVNNGNLVFRKTSATFVNQNISGAGAVYQADFGVTVLNGSNSWTGGTTIALGTIKLGHDNALPSAGSVTLLGTTNFTGGSASAVSGRGGRLDLNGFAQTIEELNAIGDGGTPGAPMDAYIQNNATLSSNIATLTINRTGPLGFNSGIHNGAERNNLPIGQIGLVKQSTGVATMNYTSTGTIATNYSGRTSINAGTLIVRGVHSPAGGVNFGTYTIAAGAALAGDGNIDAHVIANANGIIAPGVGTNSIGSLTLAGLSLNNTLLNFDISGSTTDLINVTSDNQLTLAGTSTLNLNVSPGVTAGTFTVMDFSGGVVNNLLGAIRLGTITNGGTFYFALSSNITKSTLELIVVQPIVSATWLTNASDGWNNSVNWSTNLTAPNAFGSVATFSNITAPRTVTMDSPIAVGTLAFTSSAGFNIAGSGGTTLTLGNLAAGSGVAVNVTLGSHAINVPILTNNDATFSIASGATLTVVGSPVNANGNFLGHHVTKTGTGTLVVESIRNTIWNNGTALLNVAQGSIRITHKSETNSPSGTTKVNSLSISSGARLDLTNNSMVLDFAPPLGGNGSAILAQLRGWLRGDDGRLYSSDADATHAIGYRDSTDTTGAGNRPVLNFGGITVDSSAIFMSFTFTGDTNLDGAVDISDLYNLAANYNPNHIGSAAAIWSKGDFNYDGWTDLQDLNKLAINWQAGVSAPSGQDLAMTLTNLGLPQVSVPEPATVGLISLSLTGLLARRKRRREII